MGPGRNSSLGTGLCVQRHGSPQHRVNRPGGAHLESKHLEMDAEGSETQHHPLLQSNLEVAVGNVRPNPEMQEGGYSYPR